MRVIGTFNGLPEGKIFISPEGPDLDRLQDHLPGWRRQRRGADDGQYRAELHRRRQSVRHGRRPRHGRSGGANDHQHWATNISFGPANESGQHVLELPSSTNSFGLFAVEPNIDANGNLTFTPAPNAHGTTTVTVTLQDDGGTANGGVDTAARRRPSRSRSPSRTRSTTPCCAAT